MFHTGITAQTAQLGAVHLTSKNTNSLRGLLPALGKWRRVAVLWLCSSPSLAQAIPMGGFHWCCTGQRGRQLLCHHTMPVSASAAFPWLGKGILALQFGDGWQWGKLRVLSSLSGSLSKVSESL